MNVKKRSDGYWIVGIPDTVTEAGPYPTPAEAREGIRGLTAFFAEYDKLKFQGKLLPATRVEIVHAACLPVIPQKKPPVLKGLLSEKEASKETAKKGTTKRKKPLRNLRRS